MSLFAPPIRLEFTEEEWAIINRPVNAERDGGDQQFLKLILSRVVNRTLELEDEELLKVCRYAYNYGPGGYEDRFKAMLRAAWRTGWVQQ